MTTREHNAREIARPQRIGIAIVEHDGLFLVGVREQGTLLAGRDEFPGGKCHENESPAECAARECFEETGLRVEVCSLLEHIRHDYLYGTLELFFYSCRPAKDSSMSDLRGTFRWVPRNRLGELNFPEANRNVVHKLLSEPTKPPQSE